jgi:hypothetical protein
MLCVEIPFALSPQWHLLLAIFHYQHHLSLWPLPWAKLVAAKLYPDFCETAAGTEQKRKNLITDCNAECRGKTACLPACLPTCGFSAAFLNCCGLPMISALEQTILLLGLLQLRPIKFDRIKPSRRRWGRETGEREEEEEGVKK